MMYRILIVFFVFTAFMTSPHAQTFNKGIPVDTASKLKLSNPLVEQVPLEVLGAPTPFNNKSQALQEKLLKSQSDSIIYLSNKIDALEKRIDALEKRK